MSTSVVRCSNAGGTEDVGIRAAGFGPGQMRKCATAMIDREVEILKEWKSLVTGQRVIAPGKVSRTFHELKRRNLLGPSVKLGSSTFGSSPARRHGSLTSTPSKPEITFRLWSQTRKKTKLTRAQGTIDVIMQSRHLRSSHVAESLANGILLSR
jgi:hypothetical protein